MKILKNLSIILGILIAIPLIVALFVKKSYAVERKIIIERSKKVVFDYVKYLKNQDHYSKWAMMDPDMHNSYSGTDGTVGFVASWDSDHKDIGKGEQEIVGITEGERLDFEIRFFEPFESTEPAFMTTGSITDQQTKVTWGFSGHMNYPMNLMMLFVDFEKMIGDDLANGLQNLKVELEKRLPMDTLYR